jgi:hypothetical protein
MNLKLNQDLKTPKGKLAKDSIIEVADIDGIPIDRFWRNRIKDSTTDNCVEIVSTQTKGKK